jgi:hypothetical protein
MRLNDGIRIVTQQPRRPQCRVELVTLSLQLGCYAAVENNRTDLKGIAECPDHQPNLRGGVVLVAKL